MVEPLAAVVHHVSRAHGCRQSGALGDPAVRDPVVRTVHVNECDGALDGGSLPAVRRRVQLIIRLRGWGGHGLDYGCEGVWLDGVEPDIVGVVHVDGERAR